MAPIPTARKGRGMPHTHGTARIPAILGISDRVDVEFLGSFNLHFVAENAVNDDGCRMISYLWAISVVGVSLFPYGPIFQTNHGPSRQSVKGSIDTAYKQIELGALRPGRGLLFGGLLGDFPVALQPGVQLLSFL